MNLLELKNKLSFLFACKNPFDMKDVFSLLEKYNSDDWKKYEKFNKESYSRNYFYRDDLIEIIIICWWKWQKTTIHWHPEKWGYFKLLKWKIKEDLYTISGDKIKTNIFNEGNIVYEHDSIWYHKISNNFDEEAVSLHIYQDDSSKYYKFKN